METDLVFHNELLPESLESLSFALLRKDVCRAKGRSDGAEDLEGTITLNPAGTRIYALTPNRPAAKKSGTSLWDFYFLYIPFNLHPASEGRKYREVTFAMKLQTPQAIALDLFPKYVRVPVDETHSITLTPQLKFGEIEASPGSLGRAMHFTLLYPLITGFGEGEKDFYWIYSCNASYEEVFPGCKHALVVLRVPHGLKILEGQVSYHVVTARRLGPGWRTTRGSALPISMAWQLDQITPYDSQQFKQFYTEQDIS